MVGLYARLLGPAWERVAKVVRRFHNVPPVLRAGGTFRVRRGERLVARLVAHGLGLPKAAEAVALQLEVVPEGEGERWSRRFGSDHLISTQQAGPKRLLVERQGLAEFSFRLQAENGAILYTTHSVAVCLGPMRLHLPRWLSPQVTATEAPGAQPDQVVTRVTISAPLVGLLLWYEGEVEIER